MSLLAATLDTHPRVLSLTTESFTEAAGRLYVRHGWTHQLSEDVMRRDLRVPLPASYLPIEVTLLSWTDKLAPLFFDVYQAAFRDRPGFPGWDLETWTTWTTDDDDFRPELSLLACVGVEPIAFVSSADRWIVQMGVRPEWRGQGIGSALVAEVLRRTQATGGSEIFLDVNTNNPSAANIYKRLGFQIIGSRARFMKILNRCGLNP